MEWGERCQHSGSHGRSSRLVIAKNRAQARHIDFDTARRCRLFRSAGNDDGQRSESLQSAGRAEESAAAAGKPGCRSASLGAGRTADGHVVGFDHRAEGGRSAARHRPGAAWNLRPRYYDVAASPRWRLRAIASLWSISADMAVRPANTSPTEFEKPRMFLKSSTRWNNSS